MTFKPGTYQTQELIDRGFLLIGDGYRAKNSELSSDGIPFARAGNINNGFIFDGADRFPIANLDKVGEKRSRLFDSVFTSKGTVGRIAYVKEGTPEFVYSPQLCYWRSLDFGVIEPRFLNYWMNGAEFRKQIDYLKGQTDMADYVSLRDQRRMTITIPDIETQRSISSVLGSVDDKIELNRQTNQTLEQIAQAIFKSWFVDFDPVRAKIAAREAFIQQHPEVTHEAIKAAAGTEGDTLAHAGAKACELAAICAISGKSEEQLNELDADTLQQLKTTAALFPDALVDSELGEVPEGWMIGVLGDFLVFNPKRALKKGVVAPYLDMKNVPTQGHQADDVYDREVGSGSKFINGDTLLARITPCLENGKTAYVDFLAEGQVGWGSTEYIVMRPKEGRPLSLGYLIARMDEFRAKAIQTMTGTSGRQRADAKAIADLAWINYPRDLLIAFEKISGGYLVLAKQGGDQCKTLAQLRDALLPKLLSGKISVGTTEVKLEEIA